MPVAGGKDQGGFATDVAGIQIWPLAEFGPRWRSLFQSVGQQSLSKIERLEP